MRRAFLILALVGSLSASGGPGLRAAPKQPPASSLTWVGNGIIADGLGDYGLSTSLCGLENGADVEGSYLVFVLSSTKNISTPKLRVGPTDSWHDMTKMSIKESATSSYKYVFESARPIDLASILAMPVTASWTGTATPVLTVGRGCLGETSCAPSLAVLANFNSDTLSRIDISTGVKVTPDLVTGRNPNSVALTPDGTTAMVTNQGSGTVGRYDMATGALLGTTTVGDSPFGIAITPDGATAVVTNFGSSSVSRIDVATGDLLGTTTVGTNPYDVAITPDGSTVYVSNHNSHTVSRVSISTGAVVGVDIPVGQNPSGVAINGTTLLVVNAGASTVSRIDLTSNARVDIPVGSLPFKVAITPDGQYAFVPHLTGASVARISLSDNSTTTIALANRSPFGVAITPDGRTAYITNLVVGGSETGTVSRIDVASATVDIAADIGVGVWPEGIAIASCSAS